MRTILMFSFIIMCGCSSNDDAAPDAVKFGIPDFSILNQASAGPIPTLCPSVIYEGSLIIVKIPYANIGDNYSGETLGYSWSFDGIGMVLYPPTYQDGSVVNDIIMKGEVRFFEQQVIAGPAGDYIFMYKINFNNKVMESDVSNNEIAIPVHVNKFISSNG